MTEQNSINLQTTIPETYSGLRLDQALSKLFSDYSRERLKSWIISGECLINGKKAEPKTKVFGGEVVEIKASIIEDNTWQAEEKSVDNLNIVYEDNDIIVINKPSNCVVHPGSGNASKTLVNALLYYAPELKLLPRGGIVHRLDKDTSGLMVVARNLKAHNNLVSQLQTKSVNRTYEAIVNGILLSGGTIDHPMARSSKERTKMAVVDSGKSAITHYRVLKKFRGNTYIKVQLETGRTHQIRVHMAYINYSIVGDKVYGKRVKIPKGAGINLIEAIKKFPRQALHSKILGLKHPSTQEYMQWEVELPTDMQELLYYLEEDLKA